MGIYGRLGSDDGKRGRLSSLLHKYLMLLLGELLSPLHVFGGESLSQIRLLIPQIHLSEIIVGHVTEECDLRPDRVLVKRLVIRQFPRGAQRRHSSHQLSQILGNDRLESGMLRTAHDSSPVFLNLLVR